MTLRYELKERAEASLYSFFIQSWPIIEGHSKFVDEWFLEVIAEHLELVYYRKIKNLLINVPPRTGKTSLISIAFPAWVWLKDPTEKLICASCTNSLSLDIADKSRMLIESNWYQENWGHLFKIRVDQNSKSYFANDKSGYRISTSVGSSVIGRGGSLQLTDDPNVVGGESEVVRDGVLNWWSMKWYNRLNDIPNDRRILVQQRGDEKDVSGNVIANDINNEWVKLILPLEYESENKCSTVPLWWTKGKAWEDPRTRDGELLTKRLNIMTLTRSRKNWVLMVTLLFINKDPHRLRVVLLRSIGSRYIDTISYLRLIIQFKAGIRH